jgi:hypothetical protein
MSSRHSDQVVEPDDLHPLATRQWSPPGLRVKVRLPKLSGWFFILPLHKNRSPCFKASHLDYANNFAPACTVLSTANRSVERFASQLADSCFGQLPGQNLMARRKLSPVWDWMLVTTFHSPATTSAFTDAIPGSKLLAYHFASQSASSTARSAFQLSYQNRFAPIPATSQLLARCSFTDSLD